MVRLSLLLSPPTVPVPFGYQGALTGALHKWLGTDNPYHDGTSLFGHSFLRNGRKQGDHLAFPAGAEWTIGLYEAEAGERLLDGILRDPRVAFGMVAGEARQVAVPRFEEAARFAVNGAVLVRRNRPEGGQDHLTFDDPAADEALTRVLRHKLSHAGFSGEHLEATASFDRTYRRARTRLFTLHGIRYRGSECPVILRGTPEAIRFAYVVGVGELTGCGFGALI